MKESTNTKVPIKKNGYYLLALWVELSTAMSPNLQKKFTFSWKDFEVAELPPERNKLKRPLPELFIRVKRMKIQEETGSSYSVRNTKDFSYSDSDKFRNYLSDSLDETIRSQKPSDMPSTSSYHNAEVELSTRQTIKSTLEKPSSPCINNSTDESDFDDTDVEACDNISSHSATSNFVEKAKKEGKSESEITIQRINHLSQQVVKNLFLLKQEEEARNNQPLVSGSQKRQMLLTLNEGLVLINGLRASKK